MNVGTEVQVTTVETQVGNNNGATIVTGWGILPETVQMP